MPPVMYSSCNVNAAICGWHENCGWNVRGVRKHKGAMGFGLPGFPVKNRQLEEHIKGAPFFYYENVATMPRGAWGRIQSFLFDVVPEFVDAMYFSPCRRSRGYIHNLPVEGRRKLIKDPPMTIMDLMPQTKPFWPGTVQLVCFHR